MSRDLVGEHLARWAEELVDLSRRNRLLHFKHTLSASLEFEQSAVEVEARLGRGWEFFLPDPPPSDEDEPYYPGTASPGELTVRMTPERYGPQIERGLKNLARKAQQEFLDAGLWVLYLGLGMLEWTDVDGKAVVSPLLLLPVRLEERGAPKAWTLLPSEDGEPALNPALALKLERDFEMTLPALDDLDDSDPEAVIGRITEAVADTPWSVTNRAVLTTFTFHKEVIYRDIQQNAETIAEHSMVRLLAEGPTSELLAELSFDPESEELMDSSHPPEDLTCVVDADATQRQCLIAARQGRSFVMDGPPGTGKSQTITNVIAQLLQDGKTVLFVSEKAAALEVVENRLADLKLDPFVLPLHSHKATRKAVAQELGKALAERPRARERFESTDRARLIRDREKLTEYAVAMNVVRRPLDRTLHDAIGRASELHDLPATPIPEVDVSALDAAAFGELCSVAHDLGRAWGPVVRGDDFLWRSLKEIRATAGRDENLRRAVGACRAALSGLVAEVGNVTEELRLARATTPADAAWLVELLELIEQRSPIGASWLVGAERDPATTTETVRSFAGLVRSRQEMERALFEQAPSWPALPTRVIDRLQESEIRLSTLDPSVSVSGSANSQAVRTTLEMVRACLAQVEASVESVEQLGAAFGVRHPIDLRLIDRLVGLAGLVGAPVAPEPQWLNPLVRQALDEARSVLTSVLNTYRARKDALADVFTDAALTVDLRALRTRFNEVHTGLRKLGGQYRADKKTLASVTVGGKVTKTVLGKLDEAVEWQRLAEELSRAERQHADRLGPHYWGSPDDADPDQIERAVAVALEAIDLAAGDVPPADLARQLGRDAEPDPAVPRLADEITQVTEAVRALDVPLALGIRPEDFDQIAWPDLGVWLANVAAGLEVLESGLHDVDEVVGRPLAIEPAQALASLRRAHFELDQQITEATVDLRPDLGSLAEQLDPAALEAACDWVTAVVAHADGPLKEREAGPLLATRLRARPLHEQLGEWQKTRSAVLDIFLPDYAQVLGQEMDASFEDANELLEALHGSVADVAEWEAFVEARTHLAEAGWQSVVETCIDLRVSAEQVGPMVERAVLQRWVDQIMASDKALRPPRAVDRDQLRSEFIQLDKDLVNDAAARVINTCVGRRPTLVAGEAAIIQQQSQLKRRHKPVRRLLEEAGEAAQRLKPCFMMSPLSVSQFLPPGLRFDAVVFDEASQVREADAICSIYRGRQLMVAGDPKQLPPTNFFQRMADTSEEEADEDLLDFESVLDRCKAQGFASLSLRWHYRSRHESLITFSNRSFYEGRLHTFPGAVFEAPDLGVEFFPVDGVYERGGLRDNKREAEAVVDRVLHHRQAHPELSIGVVALSGAQQAAIEDAVERRSVDTPELRILSTDDRLGGFFVKNLENVQGDERDLIILSIGYGPDEAGKMTMNFGPMSKAGGERRLNVAVTRARRRVEVVCSFNPGDLRTENPTTLHLARYLRYARDGVAVLAEDIDAAEGDAESPFEEDVLRAVRSLGYEATSQVGVAGYRIDIGVRHPSEAGTYVLGVECDGAAYHSSKVARDRDRLRQEVLEGLGWTIHRIWSTAWFVDRPGEVERLRQSIAAAVEGRPRVTAAAPTREVHVEVEEHDFDEYPDWVWAYEEPEVPSPQFAGDFTDAGARAEIAQQARDVVTFCGPVHRDRVLELLRDAWGFGRSGNRIRGAFNDAIAMLVSRGDLEEDGNFLAVPVAEVLVRAPEDKDATPRKVAQVSPAELRLAATSLMKDARMAMPVAELRVIWARLFGWRRVGADIEVAFDETIDQLVATGVVTRTGDSLRLAGEDWP